VQPPCCSPPLQARGKYLRSLCEGLTESFESCCKLPAVLVAQAKGKQENFHCACNWGLLTRCWLCLHVPRAAGRAQGVRVRAEAPAGRWWLGRELPVQPEQGEPGWGAAPPYAAAHEKSDVQMCKYAHTHARTHARVQCSRIQVQCTMHAHTHNTAWLASLDCSCRALLLSLPLPARAAALQSQAEPHT